MSSTNRANASERHVSDYYVTPQDTIKDFLAAFNADCDEHLDTLTGEWMARKRPMQILDPCAGGDSSHWMAYPRAIEHFSGWPISEITTADIRDDSLAAFKKDYMDFAPPVQPDVIITNPPFNIAMRVIEKALRDVVPGGLVVMLLRLNFFGSKERQKFFQGNMPVLTYVHTKRPKFLNTGGTDSIEYMHAVWQSENPCKFTHLRII